MRAQNRSHSDPLSVDLSYATETFSQTHVLTPFSAIFVSAIGHSWTAKTDRHRKITARHILQKNPGLFQSVLQFCPVRRERHAELRRDFNAVTRRRSSVNLERIWATQWEHHRAIISIKRRSVWTQVCLVAPTRWAEPSRVKRCRSWEFICKKSLLNQV